MEFFNTYMSFIVGGIATMFLLFTVVGFLALVWEILR